VEILMDHGLGAVAITNSMTGVAVANTVVQEILKSALEEKEGLKPPPEAKPVFSRVITWPAKKLKDVAGIYVTQSGYDIFKPTKGGLIWWHWSPPSAEMAKGKSEKKDHNDVKLVLRENGFFSKPDSPDKEIKFTEISGREVAVGHVKGQRVLLGERYRPVPMPAVWKKRLGRYEIANLPPGNMNRDMPPELQYNATSFVMDKRDGLLIISVYDSCGPADLVIEPVTNSLAFIRGLGMGKGEAVQVVKVDGGEQIRYRGSLYRKIP
jgi:hypothetical protein